MKFSDQDYQSLKTAVQKIEIGIKKEWREHYKKHNLSKTLFAFDVYHYSKWHQQEKGYNDNHIQTAMMKILKELNIFDDEKNN